MTEEMISLPGSDEMLRRLVAFDGTEHLVKGFYPRLLRSAGRTLTPDGVARMLLLAIYDYTRNLELAAMAMLNLMVPSFIEALVDDATLAGEVKNHFAAALEAAKSMSED